MTTTDGTLTLQRRDQADDSDLGHGVSLTPALDEYYWSYRVYLTEGQAVIGFPKFGIIGIGFALEEDWNTNLPSSMPTDEIVSHIWKNAGNPSITKAMVTAAVVMIQEAVVVDN